MSDHIHVTLDERVGRVASGRLRTTCMTVDTFLAFAPD